MRGSSLIVATEEYLKKNPNVDLAYELANSPLVTEVSESASELGLMQNREQDSATARLQELKKFREKKAERGTKKTKGDVIKKIKQETAKTNLSKEDLTWNKFLNEIVC